MNKLKLLLSFDYELPLGGVRSYEKGLFESATKIINLGNQLNAPVNLFADICSAIKFKVWDEKNYFIPFKNQIQRALKDGHDVQLHLHPHWLNSEYKDGRYIPSKWNMLSHFKDEPYPNNIEGIVKTGTDFLTELCVDVKKDYKCIAYRAGGFNLYPETEKILTALYQNGIRIDSSIPKNYYLKTDQITIDHRNMPKKANWFIPINGPVNAESDSGLFEISIAGKPKNFISNFPTHIKKRMYKDRVYNSTGYGHIGKQSSFIDLVRLSFAPRMLGFDLYTQSINELMNILKYNIELYKNEKSVYLSVISHPKAMGDYHVSLMKNFIEKTREKYGNFVEFISYRQAYDELQLR